MIVSGAEIDNKRILDADASTLAEMIQTREITSLKATETYISRINEINPLINSLVENRFEQALQEAEASDQSIRDGTASGKLFGVPISIKECLDVAGLKTTGGLRHLQNEVKDKNSTIVELLRQEGAIILGKTNTPSLCFYQETDNKLYGRTNNPWNLSRTAGGSSGGEGSLIAAGGASVGIGSDIGGSIRFPSHFNGVVGFKSGNQQVSYEGGFPAVTEPLQARMLGVGAMAKSVRDAILINEIISQQVPKSKHLHAFDILMPMEEITYPINQATKNILSQVKSFLEGQFTILDEQPPYYKASALIWQLIMSIDGAREIAGIAYGQDKPQTARDYVKEKLFRNSDLPHYLTWALIGANLFKPSGEQLEELKKTIIEGDQTLSEHLQNRLIILPVYHSSAPEHGKLFKELFSVKKTYLKYMPFIAYSNVWGLPTLTLPVGEDNNRLPISIQIIGLTGNENAIFQLGSLLEANFRGYRRAQLVNE